jgi:hypothetical protein
MIAERVDCYASHFGIFAGEIIFGDECLNFIAHGFIESHLSSDCRPACSFGTTARFQERSFIARRNTTHFRRALTAREWSTKSSFECSYSSRLFARDQRSLTTKLTS